MTQNSIFTNPFDADQTIQHPSLPPVIQAALPKTKRQKVGGYELDWPAETPEDTLQTLHTFLWTLDTRESRPKIKWALEILRPPDEMLAFLMGLQPAVDTGLRIGGFGNEKSFFISTCTQSQCDKIVIHNNQRSQILCPTCRKEKARKGQITADQTNVE